ncbi:hypothetical protein CROQUDRAFT_129539 [Cronartium quercuum f. sp. fusiforme G11]|uniref:Uncharacterized protein n=1 Tax=Cronartium quercuum f. sp. fusiforme G11 TaxID=708437 RepID=A0A9P6NYR7_9BASI|nr:hypothetical protein CROQUDRAFT_129539 [Cronartium quercuum f. sp. fusiforme G11]
MPYFPPNSRHQSLRTSSAKPMLASLDHQKVYLPTRPRLSALYLQPSACPPAKLDGIIFYLQGNAGNPVGRLELFRTLLLPPLSKPLQLGLFALAPRGYWSSSGPFPFPFTFLTPPSNRLTQAGVVTDYRRGLRYLLDTTDPEVPVWLYGHSLGAAVAVQVFRSGGLSISETRRLAGIVLENPLPSTRAMVKVLYPSPYVPYHYLGPFVRDEWDTISALRENPLKTNKPLLVIQSGKDELVPPRLTRLVYEAATGHKSSEKVDHWSSDGILQRYRVIPHALHDDAYLKPRHNLEFFQFIKDTMPTSHS